MWLTLWNNLIMHSSFHSHFDLTVSPQSHLCTKHWRFSLNIWTNIYVWFIKLFLLDDCISSDQSVISYSTLIFACWGNFILLSNFHIICLRTFIIHLITNDLLKLVSLSLNPNSILSSALDNLERLKFGMQAYPLQLEEILR